MRGHSSCIPKDWEHAVDLFLELNDRSRLYMQGFFCHFMSITRKDASAIIFLNADIMKPLYGNIFK